VTFDEFAATAFSSVDRNSDCDSRSRGDVEVYRLSDAAAAGGGEAGDE
jgi:hypothetical protein